jgi:hypothetical protein
LVVVLQHHIDRLQTKEEERLVSDIYSFTVTVAKRHDLDQPLDEKEAVRIVGWLLEQGSWLDVLDVRRSDAQFVK